MNTTKSTAFYAQGNDDISSWGFWPVEQVGIWQMKTSYKQLK